ncbi:MAG: DUF2721 domain-containing protein [Erythrobacter sp.]
MILNLLADATAAQPYAFEILERTASTPRVQQVVQLSLAPAFLLGAIGAVMNVIMTRLTWVAGRLERIDNVAEDERTKRQIAEFGWLQARRSAAQTAIKFATGAAVIICVVIALLFISAYIEAQIGTLIAVLWVLTMLLLVTGLGFFLKETLLAAQGAKSSDP